MLIQVLLADDHTMFRQGLRALLEREGVRVIAEAGDGREAVQLARQTAPDVAILDLTMPELNGIEAAREIAASCPRTRTLLCTMHAGEAYILEALRSGVHGYLLKSQAASQLMQAIRDVHRGAVYMSPGISRAVVESYRTHGDATRDPLSQRERQVLQLVAEGRTTKDVATLLGITTKTVESHRSRIMNKLGLHQTASLVRYAIRRGIVQP
jgi:DNA-binding NarL/FixJ family response regulator